MTGYTHGWVGGMACLKKTGTEPILRNQKGALIKKKILFFSFELGHELSELDTKTIPKYTCGKHVCKSKKPTPQPSSLHL